MVRDDATHALRLTFAGRAASPVEGTVEVEDGRLHFQGTRDGALFSLELSRAFRATTATAQR